MKQILQAGALIAAASGTPALAQDQGTYHPETGAVTYGTADSVRGTLGETGAALYTDKCDIIEQMTEAGPIYIQSNDPTCDTKYIFSYDTQVGEALEDEIGDQFIRVEELFGEILGE